MAQAVAGYLVKAVVSAAVSYAISYVLTPGVHQEGPRLSNLGVQNNAYGADLSNIWGRYPVTGNLIYLQDNKLTEVTKKKRQGGFLSKNTITTYEYYVTGAFVISVGQINAIGKVWMDAVLVSAPVNDASGLPMSTIVELQAGQHSLGVSTHMMAA